MSVIVTQQSEANEEPGGAGAGAAFEKEYAN